MHFITGEEESQNQESYQEMYDLWYDFWMKRGVYKGEFLLPETFGATTEW